MLETAPTGPLHNSEDAMRPNASHGPLSTQTIDSWDSLRTTLKVLEDTGVDPRSAVLSLLQGVTGKAGTPVLDATPLSHLEDRLGTNYVPSDSERREIRDFCALGMQKLAIVDRELETIKDSVATILARRVEIQQEIDPFLALISPMRALPPETLQEIFMACLPVDHYAIMHVSEAPLLFGRVCSAWRTISLATAALWSSIHVVVPYPDSTEIFTDDPPITSILKRCEAMQIWLSRSGNCPLSITLFVPYQYPAHSQRFIHALLPYSRRWKELKLSQISPENLKILNNLTPADVPCLESIDILDNMSTQEGFGDTLQFLLIPPRLRSITVSYYDGRLSLPSCAWGQITTLRLQSHIAFFNLDIDQLMRILEQCVNLGECRLAFPTSPTDQPSSTPSQITLARLHTFSVHADMSTKSVFNLAKILDRFTLPALGELSVLGVPLRMIGDDDEEPEPMDVMSSLEGLVSRSSCILKGLSVHNITGNMEALLRCLHGSPLLQDLELEYDPSHFSALPDPLSVLEALTVHAFASSEPPVCPNLINLRLSRCDVTAQSQAAVINLLRSRCQPDPPDQIRRLKNVKVSLERNFADLAELVKLLKINDGPRIFITEPYNHLKHMNKTERWGGLPPPSPSLFL
ncbi:hypothetical protein B0H10DRAFT_2026834 [Mycena sp. CBHHK59/15]|nr:hypothetical protein B0H10DRAFT_2026834 [Mycena sp. CBHHK59/15]